MTVKELREKLATYNDDAVVAVLCEHSGDATHDLTDYVTTTRTREDGVRKGPARKTVSFMASSAYREMVR